MLHFSRDFSFENTAAHQNMMDDAFASISEEYKSGEVGYYNLPHDSHALLDEVQELIQGNILLNSGQIKDIAVIGIGGSSLGIKAVNSLMLSKNLNTRRLHFFENSDPIDISRTMAKLRKENTLFIVISKSGSTIETTSIFKTIISYFDLELESVDSQRVIVITDKGSSLSLFAKHYGVKQFNISDNVGGRFSVLSAVGIVPLTLAGYDTKTLLDSAEGFLTRFFNHEEDHILEKACHFYEHSPMQSINVLFAYANDLENLCKWYVQLWGESLGKINTQEKNVGLTPIGLIGSIDQHSFLQLLIEGPKDKTVTFVSIEDFENDLSIPDVTLKHIEKTNFVNSNSFNTLINAQCDATRESLIQSGVSVDSIVFQRICEGNIGTMIIYYELLTSLVGAMLHVNTYDQPGVELGKDILYKKFGK
ncbi:glucose-6-phosphate isomerase [Sulfurimonas aquatica]|uniref:Glucose-6-phosphate isomerase n=1 Tax=Sulfurimonas aquatica TaxID=2672570 RepID=A0A975B0L0_9BACT|nr:glucose-6-phosphate isomerase [Sulfurimonas aquatica]QSZ41935.1 glucose-6-phosphate isomerase [Sulfurimonas aquatica]